MPSSHSGLPLFLMFPRYATILRAFIYPECSSGDILSLLLGLLQIFAQKSPQWDPLFTIFKFYFQLSPQIPISFTALFLLPLVTCIVISLTFYLVSLLSTCPFPMFNLLLYKEASGWSFVYLFSHVLFWMSYKFLIYIIFLLPEELLKKYFLQGRFYLRKFFSLSLLKDNFNGYKNSRQAFSFFQYCKYFTVLSSCMVSDKKAAVIHIFIPL